MIRKTSFLIILFLFAGQFLPAQPESMREGRITDAEMDMQFYPADSSAAAVVLFDDGRSEIEYNESKGSFEVRYTRHIRIKILTREGLDWADFSIPVYSTQSLDRVRAYTFNKENGKTERERLRNRDIIEEKRTDRLTYNKFTLPRVKEGSVIDVSYTISTDHAYRLPGWFFQYTIPVIYSNYQVIVPEYFNYRQHMTGYEHVDTETGSSSRTVVFSYRTGGRSGMSASQSHRRQGNVSYQVELTTFTAHNVPALPPERYVDNRDNYRTSVEFELLAVQFPGGTMRQYASNWDNIVNEMLDHSDFGGQLSGTRYMRDDLEGLINEEQSFEEQLAAVFHFMKGKISWNGRHRVLTDDGTRNAYRNGSGNSAEINLNLIKALNELGFDAKPVALSTRANGRIFPFQVTMGRFNHVIAMVTHTGQHFLMDATSRFADPFVLPTACLNDQGRIIDRTFNDWIALDQSPVSRTITLISAALNENNMLSGNAGIMHTHYSAAYYHNLTREGETDDLRKSLESCYQHADIQLETAELDEANQSQYRTQFNFETAEGALIAGDMIYMESLIGFDFDANPFKNPTRRLPVNFTYPRDIQYSAQFTVPEGYAVEDVPESLRLMLPDGDCMFMYSASPMNDQVHINASLVLNRIIFPPEEYPDLKAFFDRVIQKQEEKIVLKKL